MIRNKKLVLLVSVLGILLAGCIIMAQQFVCGTRTVIKGSGKYSTFEGNKIHSPLVAFPDKEMESVAEDFYYEYRDGLFSTVCQIYLKKTYDLDHFSKEVERLSSEQLTYAGQTNLLYLDDKNFSDYAYVALADWIDRYEYAVISENTHSIIYVYLENMKKEDLYMDAAYLPLYFQDDNESNAPEGEMSEEHRSFYAFKIGNQYVDCMDLVKK